MKYDIPQKCDICGLPRGFKSNHEKCSKERKKLKGKSGEKVRLKMNHNPQSKRSTREFADYILSTETLL